MVVSNEGERGFGETNLVQPAGLGNQEVMDHQKSEANQSLSRLYSPSVQKGQANAGQNCGLPVW